MINGTLSFARAVLFLLIIVSLLLYFPGISLIPQPADANGATWQWMNPLPQGNSLRAVQGNSGTDVYAVGDFGTILHYNGSTWSPMNSGTTNALQGVWCENSTSVYAVGGEWDGDGIILHYNGSTWSTMTTISHYRLMGIWGSSGSDVYAVGDYGTPYAGTIYHYDGTAWNEVSSSTGISLYGIWGSASRDGNGKANDVFVVGGTGSDHNTGTVVHYDGSTWTVTGGLAVTYFSCVWGSSSLSGGKANDVYAGGGDFDPHPGHFICHYDGTGWNSPVDVGGDDWIGGIWGSSASNVFALAGQDILHYTGGSWDSMVNPSSFTLNDIWGSSGSDIFAVGSSGVILHYNSTSWSTMSTIASTQDLNGAWGSACYNVFAVGNNGSILHYNGTSWSTMSNPAGEAVNLFCDWGNSGSDVFAGGDEGMILHYNGSAWSTMVNSNTAKFTGIWGSSGTSVYAVCEDGKVLHYNGSTWSIIGSSPGGSLYDIWGSSDSDVYAVGSNGTILYYNGSLWSSVGPGGVSLHGIWGSASRDVSGKANEIFAVGDGGRIFYYNGTSWTGVTAGSGNFSDVWGSSVSDVYAVGNTGTWNVGSIYHYNGSWNLQNKPYSPALNGIWGRTAGDVFTVGQKGTILHYGSEACTPPPAPSITSLSPNSGNQGQTLDVVITGMNFTGTTSVSFGAMGSYVTVNSYTVDNDHQITANINIWSFASPGTRNVTVTTFWGSDILNGGFTVNRAGQQTQTVNTATGTGVATFTTSGGSINNLAALTTTACGALAGYSFPHGFFSFNISNLTPGSTVIVTITLPSNVPTDTKYWKCINGRWMDVTSLLGDNNGDNVLTLTLRDGGPEDADGHANGTITDPGAPATPVTPAVTSTTPVVIHTRPPSSSPYIPPPLAAAVALPNVVVQSASLSLSKVTPGAPVIVDVALVNKSTVDGALNVKLYVNGQEEASRGATVNSGSTLPISFNISRNQPGTYSVYVGNVSAGSFTVDESADPNIILYLSSALIFIALVLGILFVRRRRGY